MDSLEVVAYTSVFLLAGLALRWYMHPLRAIPTLGGYDLPILSQYAAQNFMRNGKALLQEGYEKYHGRSFKVPLYDQWIVVVSGPKMIDELRRRPDDEVSFLEGVDETLQMNHTLGRDKGEDSHIHIDIVRDKLTRSLPTLMPVIIEELKAATDDYITVSGEEWKSIDVMPMMQKIIARISNRVFVGLPMCRNEDFLRKGIRFAIEVFQDKDKINRIPKLFKPLVGPLISQARKTLYSATRDLEPIIEERMSKMGEFKGDWVDKPNDFVQWLLEQSNQTLTAHEIARIIMLLNMAAIHTSSNSITHMLYHLAAEPEYLAPLREEVEAVIAAEGWTKAAMVKMWKLDSFMKESQRFNGIGMTALTRKVMKDITLNDGTFLPKGTLVVADAFNLHHDDGVYADANTFDGFRFARMREGEGEGTKHQFVNTSTEYVTFGHGRHACPGRFFAANELKAMLVYILLNYNLKIGGDGKRPSNIYRGMGVTPAFGGQVMFRKRQDAPVV